MKSIMNENYMKKENYKSERKSSTQKQKVSAGLDENVWSTFTRTSVMGDNAKDNST